MMGAVNELLGRNFAVGFLLPALVLLCSAVFLLDAYALVSVADLWSFAGQNQLVTTLLLPMILWFGGITLMALNHWITRLAEGYHVPWSWLFLLLAAVGLLDRSAGGFFRGLLMEFAWWPWVAPFLGALLLWLGGGAAILLVCKGLEIRLRWKNPEAEVAVPTLNPFLRRQRCLYDQKLEELCRVEAELRSHRLDNHARRHLGDERRQLELELASNFPHKPTYTLPSRFGNIVRAAETYSRKMYGFEATRGWARLLAVVPAEYRVLIDTAKAEMDFLVNIWFVSWAFLLGYFLLFEITGRPVILWPVGLAYASVRLASLFSWDAAGRWGEMIKSAADLFLPDLWRRLEIAPAASRQEELETWARLSAAWACREPSQLAPKAGPTG